MQTLHDRAIAAAMNAAFAVSEDEAWFLGGGTPSKKAQRAFSENRTEWLSFAREHRSAPVEALWIRSGALGLHNGKTGFAELPDMIRLGFTIFQSVLNLVSDALDAAEAEAHAREQASIRAADAAERARAQTRPRTAEDFEGTPLEEHADPMAPSEFVRRPAKAVE